VYTYESRILAQLAQHGLTPAPETAPQTLRDAVRDLYKYEIRCLRDRVVSGDIPKAALAGHVVELRKRYWILSVPVEQWTSTKGKR
jgi:hypothetical protein